MGKFKMSWSRLLSTESQRPRTNKKNILAENGKNHENRKKQSMDLRSDFERDYHRILSSPLEDYRIKHRYFLWKKMILYGQGLHIR